jgi:uncharacterized RDD family membrane protein YckC
MKSELHIETPEGVVFSFTLASPVARAMAWLVDALIVLAAAEIVGRFTELAGLLSQDWARALALLSYFLISMAYAIALEWFWRGQTVGKRLFHLRVIDSHGFRLRFAQIAMRNLLRSIDMLPLCYLVGGLAALCSGKAQRLGDLAAGTVVIRELPAVEPELDRIAPAKYNSLDAYPHLAARLRTSTSAEAAAIAVRALMQRDTYDPAARLSLFGDLASYFRRLIPFPDEAIEGLTDEQYIRSIVRVLYRSRRT